MLNQIATQGVDAIQSANKQFITTFVQHAPLAKILNNLVDVQANCTKAAIDAGIKASNGAVEILTDRTPYINITEKFAQYFPTSKTTKSK